MTDADRIAQLEARLAVAEVSNTRRSALIKDLITCLENRNNRLTQLEAAEAEIAKFKHENITRP